MNRLLTVVCVKSAIVLSLAGYSVTPNTEVGRVSSNAAPRIRLTAKSHRIKVGDRLQLVQWCQEQLAENVSSLRYEATQIGFFHRKRGLVYCEAIAGALCENELFERLGLQERSTRWVQFSFVRNDGRGFTREFVAKEAGVFIIKAAWGLDNGSIIWSTPTVVMVDKLDGARKGESKEEMEETFEELYETERQLIEGREQE